MKYPIEVNDSRKVNRITFKQFVFDIAAAFNLERGLIYTIKLLILKPGKLMRDYLGAHRYLITNAFRLLVITTALSLVVFHLSGTADVLFDDIEAEINRANNDIELSAGLIKKTLFEWYHLFLWISIPIYALFSYVLFAKAGYNYAEHLVLQSYYISAGNVFAIIIYAFALIWSGEWIVWATLLTMGPFYFYLLLSFFQSRSFQTILKSTVAYVASLLIYTVVLLFVLGIFVGRQLA